MLRVVRIPVRDVDKFVEYLRARGYEVEEGPHTVLVDQSEVVSVKVEREGVIQGYAVVHFITPYYRVELRGLQDDKEYLRALLEVKYSEEKWRIPVDDVAVVALSEELVQMLEGYSDEYPVADGELLVSEYRRRNPQYQNTVRLLVARLLDELA